MNRSQRTGRSAGINVILCLLFFCTSNSFGQIDFFADNYLELSVDERTDQRYFENWTDFVVQYGDWRLGARYEFHLPSQSFSLDTTGQGISQRYLEYRTGDLNLRVGNFYTILGRGLVLRSFENRVLRWDTNIDGIHFNYRHKFVDLQVMGGRPRDRFGRRVDAFQAAEVRAKPLKQFHIGGTYLITELPAFGDVWWGSGFTELNTRHVNVYGEFAYKDYPGSKSDGDAIYVSASVLLGDLSMTGEFKDYDRFDITEGTTYNNPPTAIREHLYALLNRHQLVQNANNEIGYMVQATYPVIDDGILMVNHSRTENHDGQEIYQEFYGQFELDDRPESWNWVWGAGVQEDLSATYYNLVNSASLQVTDFDAVKVIYEHQQAEVSLTERRYYSQAVSISYSRAPNWSVSGLGERSTDQLSDRDWWAGGQLDLNFWESFDLSVFLGTRREGKICIGGVCVVRPEFEGVEMTLTSRF